MKIIEDVAQKQQKHMKKNNYWKSKGIEVERIGLPCGDYILVDDKVQEMLDRKEKRGIAVKKMDFLGTFNISVDSKFSIQELIGDICGKSHDRFRDELLLAQNNGIKLYILVENEFEWIDKKQAISNKVVRSIDDLFSWKNKRHFIWRNGKQLYPSATKGSTLAKCCITLEEKYGCKFVFCTPNESGAKIIGLLTEGDKDGNG